MNRQILMLMVFSTSLTSYLSATTYTLTNQTPWHIIVRFPNLHRKVYLLEPFGQKKFDTAAADLAGFMTAKAGNLQAANSALSPEMQKKWQDHCTSLKNKLIQGIPFENITNSADRTYEKCLTGHDDFHLYDTYVPPALHHHLILRNKDGRLTIDSDY